MTEFKVKPAEAVIPSAFQEKIRLIGHQLAVTGFNRKVASILLRLAGGKSGKAFDVTVFDTQQARLHPFDNISEKRVFITPQFWDPSERAFLKEIIKAHKDEVFYFLDVGANAGLYSLYTLSVCQEVGQTVNLAAVEPDPVMRARLSHNLQASNAAERSTILPWAITSERATVTLQLNLKSRGQNKLGDATVDADSTAIDVEGHPLIDTLNAANLTRIDVMKIDIEGHEYPALQAFFANADTTQLPGYIFMETQHDDEDSALELCLTNGYEIAFQNPNNTILKR